MISHLLHLECPQCGRDYSADVPQTYCVCGSPLFGVYDFISVIEDIHTGQFPSKINSMWRYSQLLPVKSPSFIYSLGEGWTPLVNARRLDKHLGLRLLSIKDEAQNPTGSFKDRGLCVAISKHFELGARSFAMPSAGNAAVSASAYSSVAGAECHIYMPEDTPEPFFQDCTAYGAVTTRVPGGISDSAKEMNKKGGEWIDLST
ncbi:MAG: pyridoxal-phosphate dependent enzyme, partial [Candidatus Thorarchaeota archaeon]